MLRKLFFLIIFLGIFSSSAFSFWIWSPKTGKWKNPKYSPRPSPKLQLEQAQKVFSQKDYPRAYREYQKIVLYFKGSREAAEAQYYMGRCREALGKDYQAFLEYKKVIESYPFSDRIEEVIEREYKIGERLLDRYPKKILGLEIDLVEHPSVVIFKHIYESAPYSRYAPQALYRLGMVLRKISRYDEAQEYLQRLIDNYPDSEWVEPAKYQLALTKIESSPGIDYDHTQIKEAEKTFEEFIQNHPEAKISREAERKLKELREREAEKYFKIAQFYERRKAWESAKIYYQYIIDKFKDTHFYDISWEHLKELKEK